MSVGQGRQDRIGQQSAQTECEYQGGLASHLVRHGAEQRLGADIEQQRTGGDRRRCVLAEARRVDQELRHIGCVGVEGERARRGQAPYDRHLTGMPAQQRRQQ